MKHFNEFGVCTSERAKQLEADLAAIFKEGMEEISQDCSLPELRAIGSYVLDCVGTTTSTIIMRKAFQIKKDRENEKA